MKLRKVLSALCAAVLAASLLAACGGTAPQGQTSNNGGTNSVAGGSGKTLNVALLLNGTMGDKSFFDSANNGMTLIKEKLGAETKVVEVGYDDTKWEPALQDLCDEGNHDIIICGTWQMQEVLSKIAPEYPDQKFIVFDTAMDYSNGAFPNVYSIEYKQNDGSFLAGVLAASVSKTGSIGFVGGMDNTVIYDFLVGYIQGAQSVKKDIKVSSSFVGDFSNTARAKELALSQYQMGTDIIFSCASTAGDGTIQAGKEMGKWLIGVDSDQALLYKETDPELAKLILSSVLKRVDISLLQAVEKAAKGELKYGEKVAVGIPEDCIGLADNEIYQAEVPADVRTLITQTIEKIKDGSIEVKSAFGMDTQEVVDFVNAAK